MISLTCGANTQELESEGVVGQRLSEVRRQVADVLNVPTPCQSMLGGRSVPDDYVLQEGDHIEFVKPAGEKG